MGQNLAGPQKQRRLELLRDQLGSARSQLSISEEYGDVVGAHQFKERIKNILEEIASMEKAQAQDKYIKELLDEERKRISAREL